jgi:hypothetical protein
LIDIVGATEKQRRSPMSNHPAPLPQPGDGGLHPRIYGIMIALTVWLVLSIWFLFDRGQYVSLTLAMITLFFVIMLAIPSLLWLTWQRNAASDEIETRPQAFSEWASRSFDTWTERLTGKAAAIQILLPIAAVAFGMTIFGLVYYFDVPHLS